MGQATSISPETSERLGDLSLQYGIPFLASACIALALLAYAKFDVRYGRARLTGLLGKVCPCFKKSIAALIAALFLFMTIACVIGTLIAFGIEGTSDVEPQVIAPVLVCTAAFLVLIVFAGLKLASDHWRFGVAAKFACGLALIAVLTALAMVLWLIDQPRTFRGTSYVYLAVNFCIMAFLLYELEPTTELKKFVPLLQQYSQEAATSDQLPDAKTHCVSQVVPRWIYRSGGSDKKLDELRGAHWSLKMVFVELLPVYILNLLVLAAYAINIQVITDDDGADGQLPSGSSIDDANFVGWAVAGCVAYFDIFILLLKRNLLLRDINWTLGLMFLSRALLVAPGQRQWFHGTSTLYCLFSLAVLTALATEIIPLTAAEAQKLRLRWASGITMDAEDGQVRLAGVNTDAQGGAAQAGGGDTASPDAAPHGKSERWQAVKTLTSYTTLLAVISVPYWILWVLVYAETLYAPEVAATDEPHSQATYSVCGIILTGGLALGYASFRMFNRVRVAYTSRHTISLVLSILCAWCACAVAGIVFYELTSSILALALCIFAPGTLLFGYIAASMWSRDFYHWLPSHAPHSAVEARRNSQVAPSRGAGDQASAPVPQSERPADQAAQIYFKRTSTSKHQGTRHRWRFIPSLGNANTVIAACLALLLWVSMAVTVGVVGADRLDHNYDLVGVSLGFLGVYGVLLVLVITQLYNTQELRASIEVLVICAVAVISTYAAVVYGALLTDDQQENSVWRTTITALFLLPVMLAAITSFVLLLRAHKWNMTPLAWVSLAVTALAALVFAVLTVYFWKDDAVTVGAGFVAVYVVAIFIMYASVIWVRNEYVLPKWIAIIGVLALLLLVAGSAVMGALTERGLLGFGVAWVVFACLILLLSGLWLKDSAKWRNIFGSSPLGLPAFKLDVDKRVPVANSLATIGVIAGLSMIGVFGLLVAIFVGQDGSDPGSVAGVATTCAVLCIAVVFLIRASKQMGMWLAEVVIYLEIDQLESLRQRAIQSASESSIGDQTLQFQSDNALIPVSSIDGFLGKEDAAWEGFQTASTSEQLKASIDSYRDAKTATTRQWQTEQKFLAQYTFMIVLAGRFLKQQAMRDMEEFLRSHGIQGADSSDVDSWPATLRHQLALYLGKRGSEAKKRRAILESERMRKSTAKRDRVNAGSTVLLLDSQAGGEGLLEGRRLMKQAIESYEQSLQPWSDSDFEPYNANGVTSDWRYPDADLFDGHVPRLVSDRIEPTDLLQGRIGNCWFIAAMATVASKQPELIAQLYVPKMDGQTDSQAVTEALKAGIIGVKLHRRDQWWLVLVDTRIPWLNGEPAFVHSSDKGEIWPCLLEKAYAKLYSTSQGYEQIVGGVAAEGMSDLTGYHGEYKGHTETDEDVITGKLWRDVHRWVNEQGFLCGAGSKGEDDTNISDLGIVQGHAYSILAVAEVDGLQLLRLRNPWGDGTEWKGDWSDKSPLWKQHPKAACKLHPEDSDDGSFWMSWSDYIRYFRHTDVLYATLPSQWTKHEFIMQYNSQSDMANASGGLRVHANPQYWITAKATMEVVVEMEQRVYNDSFYASCALAQPSVTGHHRVKYCSNATQVARVYNGKRATATWQLARSDSNHIVAFIFWPSEEPGRTVEDIFDTRVTVYVNNRDKKDFKMEPAPTDASIVENR